MFLLTLNPIYNRYSKTVQVKQEHEKMRFTKYCKPQVIFKTKGKTWSSILNEILTVYFNLQANNDQ